MPEQTIEELLSGAQVINIEPGDTLVFQFDRPLTKPEAQEVRDMVAERLDSRIRFLVVGAGVDLKILRPVD